MTVVKNLNNKALVAKLKSLVKEEKKNIAAQIALLREVKRRNLALELGFPSLKAFCEKELELTEDQAWKRSQAAGAVDKAPDLFPMLLNGQTSLSAIAAVASKITDQTKEEITDFIPQKSKREMEAFASTLRRDGSRIEKPQTVRRAFDLTLQTHDKLKHAAKLLRQNQPDLSEGDVLDAALELLLDKRDPVRKAERAKARNENKAGTASRPAETVPGQEGRPAPLSNAAVVNEATVTEIVTEQSSRAAPGRSSKRYIPAKTRHSIYLENEVRCAFVGSTGKLCDERHGLHIDHAKPFAFGGTHEPENLRLLCPAHNRHIAPPKTGLRTAPGQA